MARIRSVQRSQRMVELVKIFEIDIVLLLGGCENDDENSNSDNKTFCRPVNRELMGFGADLDFFFSCVSLAFEV